MSWSDDVEEVQQPTRSPTTSRQRTPTPANPMRSRLISIVSATWLKIRKNLDPTTCTMSLGDHLEELRARLILAILGLVLGAIVSLIFGKHILGFMRAPYDAAMRDYVVATETPRMQKEMLRFRRAVLSDPDLATRPQRAPDRSPADQACPGYVHRHSQGMDRRDANRRERQTLPAGRELQTLAPAEAFMAYMKISFHRGPYSHLPMGLLPTLDVRGRRSVSAGAEVRSRRDPVLRRHVRPRRPVLPVSSSRPRRLGSSFGSTIASWGSPATGRSSSTSPLSRS